MGAPDPYGGTTPAIAMSLSLVGPLLPAGKEVISGASSLQSSYTGRLYLPSPF